MLFRHRPRALLGALTLFLFAVGSSCVDSVEVGRDRETPEQDGGASGGGMSGGTLAAGSSASGAGGAGSAGIGGRGGEAGAVECQPAECLGIVYDCGDCADNDADGFTDAADSQCTGPCDNTEDSLFGGIPGANNAPCRHDCYFDANSGGEDDNCYWSHECDVLSQSPSYPPSGNSACVFNADAKVPGSDASCDELHATQSPQCGEFCGAITPNGCDCFGCCELPARSQNFVFIGSTVDGDPSCDLANVNNPAACRPCTPVPGCQNECGPCERCVGGAPLDPGCGGGEAGAPNTSSRCEPAVTPCGEPGEAMCPVGEYCITGCCMIVPK
jgi:hypothetical protein